jgi:tRNA pseudouridine55 synthase
MKTPLSKLNGALLIDKHAGVSSFGIIELLQRSLCEGYGVKRRELPKLGHGGTLDPFATGLLIVCVGRAVKLARYFLGATKSYEGRIRFGETTVPGDPTAPVSETSSNIPGTREEIQEMARRFSAQAYLQVPPMHSAKKKDGKPLYELAREGIEVEREPKLCHIYQFDISAYDSPVASFHVRTSSGTYVRTLAQDFARLMGSVALLDSLNRTAAGVYQLKDAMTIADIGAAVSEGRSWDQLPCWMPFDRLLDGYERAEATSEEANALIQGRQAVLFNILKRAELAKSAKPIEGQDSCMAIFESERLIAVARREEGIWSLERVFTSET